MSSQAIHIKLFLLIMLSGCTSAYKPFPYAKNFKETQLSENIFNVSFTGNTSTSKEAAVDFVMLRSADLTLSKQYRYFKIIYSIDDSQSSISTPLFSSSTPLFSSINEYNPPLFTTTFSTGNLYDIDTKPKILNTIACFKDKPKDGIGFDAQKIKQAIMAKYDLKEEKKTDSVRPK